MSARITRGDFLKGAGAAWIALVGLPGCESAGQISEKNSPSKPASSAHLKDVQVFRSRPDLAPPAVVVNTRARETAPGYVFVAPKKGGGQDGPMILDGDGRLVWFYPVPQGQGYAMDFKVQSYRGEPVVTWWQGKVRNGHGIGEYVVVDGSYRVVAGVPASRRYDRDLHEFNITSRDTALLTAYNEVPADLSPVGGSVEDTVLDGIAQEVDIETGEVLFEWHSLDHVGIEDSYSKLPEDPDAAHDYFHINSIEVDSDENLLISSRTTSAVYKVDRETGAVMWRLGGKSSDFEMGDGTRTAFQHDARRQPDGTITIFDNGGVKTYEQSRGVVVRLDEDEMTATLVREYTHPDKILAATQGNLQSLPNGNVFMGWGSEPFFSEFSGDGELLFDAGFRAEAESYRAFRFEWSARPGDAPSIVAEPASDGEVTIYASWNGATEVAAWEALAGPNPGRLKPVGSVPRDGFETAITVRTTGPYVAARARDRSGNVLGVSRAVKSGSREA